LLRELLEVAIRFRDEGKLLPNSTKPRQPRWVVEVDDEGNGHLRGPYSNPDEHRAIVAFDRQRSGTIAPSNLKPYLLMDDGRYALGKAEPGKDDLAALAHKAFVDLLELALKHTGDPEVAHILQFLRRPLPKDILQKVGPKEIVTFRGTSEDYPSEREPLQRFWCEYLSAELATDFSAICSLCGRVGPILRVLPSEIVLMGQKCSITSFDDSAFTSRGKRQSANAPLCYDCAASAIGALSALIRDPRHHSVIARDKGKGPGNPMRNELAIYWLREPQGQPSGGISIDLEDAISALLRGENELTVGGTPPPDLAQLERLLNVSWTASASAAHLSTNSFNLAVLSANKARLVVREWLVVPLDDLRDRLGRFLQGTRIVGPNGEAARALAIPAIVDALETTDPQNTRGLLRVAFLGDRPPEELCSAALLRFRNVLLSGKAHNTSSARSEEAQRREQLATLQVLAAVIKLTRTYGGKEAETLEHLDRDHARPAYACGRLLAALEEAQRRASRGSLNATLVDRFYAAASTAPASTLGTLIERAQTSHLPKIRKENRGYRELQELIQEIMGHFQAEHAIPHTLTMPQQADFALGYYHQRAAFRRN
jgi:CRISPR-associated protein Csd1